MTNYTMEKARKEMNDCLQMHQESLWKALDNGLRPDEYDQKLLLKQAVQSGLVILDDIPQDISSDTEDLDENVRILFDNYSQLVEDQIDLQTEAALIKVLINIGFLAMSTGRISDAEKIFKGLKAVRPDSQYPLISEAMAKMSNGDFADAIHILKNKALVISPECEFTRLYLALAYMHTDKKNKALDILKELDANAQQEEVLQAAANMLSNFDVLVE